MDVLIVDHIILSICCFSFEFYVFIFSFYVSSGYYGLYLFMCIGQFIVDIEVITRVCGIVI